MIDLSSLSASMTNSVMPEGGPSKLSSLAGGPMMGTGSILATDTAAASTSTSTPGGQQLSADGFMQVLDMFLGGSPLPSALLASTATEITQTPTATTAAGTAPGDVAAMLSTGSLDEKPLEKLQGKELDDATAERIASVLQMLGIQVKPAEIQELSTLDREQLGTALEFVQRNLQKGASPGAIAENATLLLPRAWPLDDADGSPVSIGDTTGTTDSNTKLPLDFAETLSDLRSRISASLGHASPTSKTASTDATTNVSTIVDTKGFASTQTGNGQNEQSSLGAEGDKSALAPTVAKKTVGQDPSVQWAQQLQQANLGAPVDETTPTSIPRHLAPGGTTSELIGRQVLEKIHVQLNEGHREVKLRLWPEELGEVRLSLKMTDGEKVHANMVVENDAVRQAMLDATPQLKDALARHGLDLERLSVSVSQKDSREAGANGDQGGKDEQRNGRNGRGNGGWNEAHVGVEQELVLGEDTGKRNGRNTIDLWS